MSLKYDFVLVAFDILKYGFVRVAFELLDPLLLLGHPPEKKNTIQKL